MTAPPTPILKLTDIHKSYNVGTPVETEVLHGITLALREAEFVALKGPSGSGKSTLLNIIGLLERPTAGTLEPSSPETALARKSCPKACAPPGRRPALWPAAGMHTFDWASCDYYAEHGKMMPDDWKAQLSGMDAIFFGAVGWPATVPDHVSLWGSLLKFRREFDQYINLRPVRLFEGVPCPLAGRKPGDIDYYVVRENTEGEYTSLGGVMYEGTDREIVIQESVYSRHGANRLLKFAFDLAQSRPKKHVTLATKSNGIAISMPWWDKRATTKSPRTTPRSRWTSSTSTSSPPALCCSPAALTWWPPPTCLATSSRTWAPPPPAPLAWPPRPT
jgi:energy-coupling factor transporter ATP-binding protein EcfA2